VRGDEFRIRILEPSPIRITHRQFDQHRNPHSLSTKTMVDQPRPATLVREMRAT
jgi:hypothetical protein